MILNGINNKNNGVLRVNSTEKQIKLNLNIEQGNYILVLKSDKIVGYNIKNLTENIVVKDVDLTGELIALLVGNNQGIMYGTLQADRLKAFSLLSFYNKNKDEITIKAAEIYDNSAQKQINNAKKIDFIVKENDIKNENNTAKNINFIEEIMLEKDKNIDINDGKNVDNIEDKTKQDERNNSSINNKNDTINNDNYSNIFCDENSKNITKKIINNEGKIQASKENKLEQNGGLLTDGLVYKGDNFYLAIHNQIDEIFVCYKEEVTLNNLINNSRWARIDYAEDEYYVIGVIKENEQPKYICYGIPGIYSVKPPKEVEDFARWQYLSKDNPKGEGYWLIYQDAKNGNTIKNNE